MPYTKYSNIYLLIYFDAGTCRVRESWCAQRLYNVHRGTCDFCDVSVHVHIEQRLLDSTRHFFLSFVRSLSISVASSASKYFLRMKIRFFRAISWQWQWMQSFNAQRKSLVSKKEFFGANEWPPASMSLMACAASSSLKVMQVRHQSQWKWINDK